MNVRLSICSFVKSSQFRFPVHTGGEALEALPLLRGVVHECHRFLICYPDPSILFSTHPRPTHPQTHSIYPSNSATPDSLTPEDEHERTWDCCGSKPIQPRKKW